jgi:ankyrin repeat protein
MAEEARGFTKRLMMLGSSIRSITAAAMVLSCMAAPTFATDFNDRLWNYGELRDIKAALEDSADDRLWNAAARGDLEGVRAALQDGADVDTAQNGSVVLNRAVSSGNPDVVSLLLRRGANVNIVDQRWGYTPLVNAITGLSDPYRVAGMLIANGANVRKADQAGWTPVHWAASNGQQEIVNLLLHNGADINALDAERHTPLDIVGELLIPDLLSKARDSADYLMARGAHTGGISADGNPLADVDRELFMATIAGNAELVRQAVAQGAHVNVRDSLFRSPLIRAAQLGRWEATKALLDNGADLELTESRWPLTPLHVAAAGGYANLVELLLAHGVKVDVTAASGITPLRVVGNAETAVVLLRAGADANTPDLLCIAAWRGDGKLVELLLSYGADANAKCGKNTPLLSAIELEKWEVVSILLDHGADANATAGYGWTALTLAAERAGGLNAVARLLVCGANPNTPDGYGETALTKAALYGRTDVIKVLLDHGAKAGVRKATGLTALGMSDNHIDTADLLISHGANVDDLIPRLLGEDATLDDQQRALFRAVATDSVRSIAGVPNSVSKQFPGGLTPLLLATILARTSVTDWLLEHGANPNEPDSVGMAPLHRVVVAATRRPEQKIRLIGSLLNHGADIDVTENSYGVTPLHLAAATFNKDVVEFLLRNGADPLRRTKQGYTPVQLAQRAGAAPGDLKQKTVTIESLRRAVSSRPIQP